MLKLMFVVCALMAVASAQIISGGSCPDHANLQPMKNFDWARYAAPDKKWYQLKSIRSSIDLTGKCTNGVYKVATNETSGILAYSYTSMELPPGTYDWKTSNGAMTIPDLTQGRYSVKFSEVQSAIDVMILETDYDNYAVAYSCLNVPFHNYKFAWVKSRNRLGWFMPGTATDKLSAAGFNTTLLLPVDQFNCPIDH